MNWSFIEVIMVSEVVFCRAVGPDSRKSVLGWGCNCQCEWHKIDHWSANYVSSIQVGKVVRVCYLVTFSWADPGFYFPACGGIRWVGGIRPGYTSSVSLSFNGRQILTMCFKLSAPQFISSTPLTYVNYRHSSHTKLSRSRPWIIGPD